MTTSHAPANLGATVVLRPTERTRAMRPWERHASLAVLLVGTGVLYLVGLSASGWANSFYSAAAQAGSADWTAFLYGSLDAGNAITVDKPPASLWVMALSVRLFGLNSWSILVPQALMGVATVFVTFRTVRRVLGEDARAHWAGIAAGLTLALTPAAALMFRFNNPDALLVLLTALATHLALRATEKASGRLLVLAGVMVGLGFLTKMLQAFLVLPALVAVYAVAAPTTLRRRLLHLVLAFSAMIIALGWWVAIVELVPADQRPYVGGSQNDSVLELIFGYNGLGRITGNEVGSVTAGAGMGGMGGMWGDAGITRLFSGVSGGMIAWLIPAALVMATMAFGLIGRAPRTDLRRAGLIAFTGGLVTTGAVFSFMAGIYHDYYTVALAPFIAGTLGISGAVLWQQRHRLVARIGLGVATLITGIWSWYLLQQAGSGWSLAGWVVLIMGALAGIALLISNRLPRLVATLVLTLSFALATAGPASYAINTAATPHQGSIVTAGPVTGIGGGPGGRGGDRQPPGRGQGQPDGTGLPPGMGQGQPPGAGQGQGPGTSQGQPPGTGQEQGPGGGGRDGGGGGLLNGATVSEEMRQLLTTDGDSFIWAAATTGSQTAASYQLATGLPVMAIGGFNGSDDSPTLAEFQQHVAEGRIHYYLAGDSRGRMQQNGGSTAAAEIAAWVEQNYTPQTVGQTTVYDLTGK